MNKIVSKDTFQNCIRPELKKEGKTIALCHGVFDLVHPGHVIHLEQAKAMAEVLVVSITAAKYVRKGPGRPYFDDDMRMKFLAALECVDYVLLSEGYTVDDIIETVEPDIYVKGEEYAKAEDDITGMITKEKELVEAHGGRLGFTTGQTFSSTKLINTAMSGLTDEVRQLTFDDLMSVTDEDNADRLMSEGSDRTVVSYIAVPTDAVPGSYCYKMLIDNHTHMLYYFKKHRITKKTGPGFLAEDLRRLSSFRK